MPQTQQKHLEEKNQRKQNYWPIKPRNETDTPSDRDYDRTLPRKQTNLLLKFLFVFVFVCVFFKKKKKQLKQNH